MKIKKYQSILEYVLLVTIATAAVGAMYVYVKRAMNAHLKVVEEQLSNPEVIDEVR